MDGRIMRYSIISSCQSAAISEIAKRFWTSLTHVSGAVASISTCTFTWQVLGNLLTYKRDKNELLQSSTKYIIVSFVSQAKFTFVTGAAKLLGSFAQCNSKCVLAMF